jgi:hypothetical protein
MGRHDHVRVLQSESNSLIDSKLSVELLLL